MRNWSRRAFIRRAAALPAAAWCAGADALAGDRPSIFVSPAGDDANSGTLQAPLKTLARAFDVRQERFAGKPWSVLLREGVYEQTNTLSVGPADSGLRLAAYNGERAILSGGTRLRLEWKTFRDGILC